MKQCKTCGEIKALDEFVIKKHCKDGRGGSCKTCSYNYHKAYLATDKGKASRAKAIKKYTAKYREKYPNKRKAVTAVYRAVRSKKIDKPVLCQYCGSYKPLEGHHRDYNKPLDVQWLCSPCHNKWHAKNEALNP